MKSVVLSSVLLALAAQVTGCGQRLDTLSTAAPASLAFGSTGSEVRRIQSRLTELGYPVQIDGDFGPETESAVKRFQRAKGLVADGVVGPLTMAQLFPSQRLPPTEYGGVVSGDSFLLTRASGTAWGGLNALKLTLLRNGKEIKSFPAVSGLRSRQNSSDYGTRSRPGSPGAGQPIPEGTYSIAMPRVGGNASGVGSIWLGLGPDPSPRGSFGIHQDIGLDGTLGCVALKDEAAIREAADLVSGGVRKLIVDWGKGSLSLNFSLAQEEFVPLDESSFASMEEVDARADPETGEIVN